MTTSVSINKIIDITSQAISSNSNGFNLAGMILDENSIIPFNTVLTFTSSQSVSNYFGATSNEYLYAQNYFNTYTNNINTPSFIKYYRFVTDAISPFIRGAALNSNTDLTALQAITAGSLSVIFGGTTYTATGIDLSSDTTFSLMAATLQTALQAELVTATVTWDSVTAAFTINSEVTGSSVGYSPVTSLSTTMKITQAAGATLSQGSADLTPAANMNNLVNQDTNWFSFTTLFTIYNEMNYVTAFALIAWLNSQILQYTYIFWTLETALTTSVDSGFAAAAVSAGYAAQKLNASGQEVIVYNVPIVVQYGGLDLAHAIMGTGASIDYTATNGTISFNAKTFAGITPTVNTDSIYDNLIANGCNFYSVFSNRGDTYNFYELGTVGGNFLWLDNLYNDAWQLNAQVTALANLQSILPKLPANSTGESFVNAELVTVANQAITNGTIGIGNTFTSAVISQLKTLAGFDISTILTNAGYYIQITIDRINRVLNYKYFYTTSGAIVTISGQIIAVL
jgi:hypothetical protein